MEMKFFFSSLVFIVVTIIFLGTYELQDYGDGMKMKRCGRRTTLHGPEHVIAERKRREKLNQRFAALSAIIPGLTKVLQINSFCVKIPEGSISVLSPPSSLFAILVSFQQL